MKAGKKTKEWWEAKERLIKIYEKKKITKCENCGSKFALSFHHRPKRSSQKAIHDFEHTRLLCGKCHSFFEMNNDKDKLLFSKIRGYNPKNEIKITEKKSKKADWEKLHKCKNCKGYTSMLICDKCGGKSI